MNWNDVLVYDETSHSCLRWRSKNRASGFPAGTKKPTPYYTVSVGGYRKEVHRIIWEMFNGPVPAKMHIDHHDMDKTNNRIGNLRLATPTENNRNKPKKANNKSGFKGVSWDKKNKKWFASIKSDTKLINLCRYHSAEAAHLAYCYAAHALHGEFARTS